MRKIHKLNVWVLVLIIIWFSWTMAVELFFTTPWASDDIWVIFLAWLHIFFWLFWIVMKYWEFSYIPGEKKEEKEEPLFLHNENQNIEENFKESSESTRNIIKIIAYSVLWLTILYVAFLIVHLILTTYFEIL